MKVCKERFLPKCSHQMRIGYITCYNTPDNLRIALEDNLIEISAKNSENHRLRINTNTFISNRPTMQRPHKTAPLGATKSMKVNDQQ